MTISKISALLFSAIVLLSSCSNDNDVVPAPTTEQTNKQLVLKAIEQVFDGQNVSLVDTYYADGLIQHFPDMTDGKAGLIAAINNFINNKVTVERETARVIAQGDKVFVQSRVRFIQNGTVTGTSIIGDIFRIENNLIKEVWGVVQSEPNPAVSTANGNTMIDGGGNPNFVISQTDLTKNANTATTIMQNIVGNAELNLIPTLFQEPYAQHNPNIPNGTDALRNFLTNNGALNLEVKQVIAEGDLVVTFNHVKSFNNANIDMFRFNADGRAVEHWDIIQRIPNATDFQHNNGFF